MYRSFLLLLPSFFTVVAFAAPAPKAKAPAASDTLVFENGDTLTGQLEREVSGTISFKSNEVGELNIPWSKIKSLHTKSGFVVLENKPGVHLRHYVADVSQGEISVKNGEIRVSPGETPMPVVREREIHGESAAPAKQPIPVANAQFILDEQTFDRQVREEPNLFAGWNGSATAGITLVQATENQYSYTSAISLVRTVPTVTWLPTRNRTQLDFSSSYGEITQPAYTSGGVSTAAVVTKTSIFHADAERDEYLASRVYGVFDTAFDHNYAQGLDLQSVAGAGFGFTVVKRSAQQLDLKGTLQYEQQRFITSASGTNEDLVGSTLSGTYAGKLKGGLTFNAQAAYVPAYNVGRAYSANETTTLTIPFYKNVAFTLGTIDSYLNDPVAAEPPIKRNSFQFTSGVTYTIKSKY